MVEGVDPDWFQGQAPSPFDQHVPPGAVVLVHPLLPPPGVSHNNCEPAGTGELWIVWADIRWLAGAPVPAGSESLEQAENRNSRVKITQRKEACVMPKYLVSLRAAWPGRRCWEGTWLRE